MSITVVESDANGILSKCEHCGNHTILYVRAEYEYTDDHEESGCGPIEHVTWWILECAACSRITVEEHHALDYGNVFEGNSSIHYPPTKLSLDYLPDVVRKAYMAARKVRNVEPNACAVLIGRTLEAACNQENAQGRVLADKLKFLANSGRIPDTLVEMAQYVKELRNMGAHNAEDEVTEEDVPIMLDFLEAILEYLYVAPAKIEAVRARLKKHPKRVLDHSEE